MLGKVNHRKRWLNEGGEGPFIFLMARHIKNYPTNVTVVSHAYTLFLCRHSFSKEGWGRGSHGEGMCLIHENERGCMAQR